MKVNFLAAIFLLGALRTFAGQAYSGLSPEDAVKAMTLPEGFHASLVAAEPLITQPVAFEFDDRGRLWVAEFLSYPKWAAEGHDRIVMLEDTDGDGRMDKRTVVWEQGNYLTGFTLGFGGIWVTTPPNLLFIPCDFNADVPKILGKTEIVLDGWSHAGTHNVVNGLTWGPDGWLYGMNGISSRSRVGAPGTAESARVFIDGGVWRIQPITKKLESICTGGTNPWGMDWDQHGELFITNNVTAHIFHVVPGARFERSHESDQNPYTYELMGGIADHKHYEGVWTDIRKPGARTDLGGGHSHVGALIYKCGDWPEKYRDTIFMCNTHGNRINTDKLELTPSGYIAHHGEDFMLANDKSFRGVTLKMGPEGAMYVSDWHQDGECHSGSEVGSGRIFRIQYGDKKLKSINALEIARALLNTPPDSIQNITTERSLSNPWVAKHTCRLIKERDLEPQGSLLNGFVDWHGLTTHRRFWKSSASPSPLLNPYSTIASIELAMPEKKIVLRELSLHALDTGVPNNRLMLWYSIEPLVESDPDWALTVFRETRIPALRPFVARRLSEHKHALVVDELAKTNDRALQIDLLKGLSLALKGRRKVEMPASWKTWQERATEAAMGLEVHALTTSIAAAFGDLGSLDELRKIALDKKADVQTRRNALQSLVEADDVKNVALFQKLVRDLELRRDALRALARFDDSQTPALILQLYPNFDAQEKADALNTFAARAANARLLLGALKLGTIKKAELNAALVRALEAHGISELDEWIKQNWGSSRKTAEDKLADIARLKKLVGDAAANSMDAARGREVFKKTCANCHTLFGDGGKVGPDLTGSARKNLDYLLQNIVDPNAIVPQEYMAWMIKTNDGRTLSGLIRNETENAFDVMTGTEVINLKTDEIKIKKRSELSLMPEGILNALKDQEILDLIAYLQSGN